MKLTGFRVFVLVSCILAAFVVIGVASSVAELESIVGNEIIGRIAPNITAAAGMDLAAQYADSKTQAELETLVTSGKTAGIKMAARMALSIVYSKKTVVELTALATGDIDPAIREAASVPLQKFLIGMSVDDLKTMATSGATHEIRLAAANLYYLKIRSTLTAKKLEKEAVTNDSKELEEMAGQYLGGFYLSFDPKTQDEMIDLAKNGKSEGMRIAGATALTTLLINSKLTAGDLEKAIADIGTKYPQLLKAYTDALAHRYSS